MEEMIIGCEFNMNTVYVELKFSDGSMISIDTISVENEVADNMYEQSEMDYLIYNALQEYVDLVLNGDPEAISQGGNKVQTVGLTTTSGFSVSGFTIYGKTMSRNDRTNKHR